MVPTSDWPLGVTSGKYDAAISNITVTKERKAKFDFATYRKDSRLRQIHQCNQAD